MSNEAVNSPFDRLIGTTIESAGPTQVITSTPIRPDLTQPHGFVHGGLLATLSETAASIGAGRASPSGSAVGQSNHTEFLRPATPESKVLTATATPIRVGRQVQIWEVRITDQRALEIARSTIRLFNVNPPRSAPAQ
ncbi:PaaI family thioesterase [Stomatohabitans albus]|uniref:PaaI family thioesterase n=1 Tax=Stomatohabitans albus TaxID=3110766 RepID=UPI00300D10A8